MMWLDIKLMDVGPNVPDYEQYYALPAATLNIRYWNILWDCIAFFTTHSFWLLYSNRHSGI